MHILLIPSWYPTAENPYNGNFIQRHAELLAEKHRVTVLYFTSEKIPEAEIETQQNGQLQVIHVRYPKKNNKIGQFLSLRRSFNAAIKTIKQVDLIHVHVVLDRGILGVWAKKHFSKPLVVTEHGSYLFRENYRQLSTRQKMIIIQTLKHVSAMSCVSQALADEIRYLFPRAKTALTPNVIRRDLFTIAAKPSESTTRFIHISTLEPVKNVPEMIRAFELLDQTQPDFTLRIICEKADPEIRQQVESSVIRAKIRLEGPLPIEKVAEAVQQSDALVMLSSHETFSCVIAEAWSAGKAIISTPVGIAAELPAEAGILVPEATSTGLNTALQQFIAAKNSFDPVKIRALTEAYTPEAVAESFEQFYASVLKH
ncbi:MAG: hypothetical protein K0R65_151 [Crocinitomicaceae bacterium]|jgi:glycosyltransferase involved in cell wall biosynthesis|nr:hypothetical protein [Crocinitomicaceae bacterium]